MSGVLNQGLTKKKNVEFRQKLESWKKRKPERKRIQARTFEQGKQIREELQKLLVDFEHDKSPVADALVQFENVVEDLQRVRKEEKVCNDLLSLLPESSLVELK